MGLLGKLRGHFIARASKQARVCQSYVSLNVLIERIDRVFHERWIRVGGRRIFVKHSPSIVAALQFLEGSWNDWNEICPAFARHQQILKHED